MTAVLAETNLREQNRPPALDPYRQRDQSHERRRKNEPRARDNDVECALGRDIRSPRRCVDASERMGVRQGSYSG